MKSKFFLLSLSATAIIGLSGCGNDDNDVVPSTSKNSTHQKMDQSTQKKINMEKSGSSAEVPKSLKKAKNPAFKIGDMAKLKADHMPGMKGAEAEIVGAFNTNAYVVDYKPTSGGPEVKNHKWVIQEEIKEAGSETLKPGTPVNLEADHMKGMKGAKATIVSVEPTTVYMVNYTPTTGGPKIKNHKWVIESELEKK